MKIIISVLLTIIIGFVAHQYTPWWFIVIVVALVCAGTGLKNGAGFVSGFLGVALLWGLYAGWINAGNEGILASRMGNLFGGLSSISIVLITALIAGILGGLAGLTGSLGRQALD